MLLDIKCNLVASIGIELKFDDGTKKDGVLSINDLVDVCYNSNGQRRHIVGRIIQISAIGLDPKGWYIIVDGSDDFQAEKARFSPMSILDFNIIAKGDQVNTITSPKGIENILSLRINQGRLQYTQNGLDWEPIKIDDRDVIKPDPDDYPEQPSDNDQIEDAVY